MCILKSICCKNGEKMQQTALTGDIYSCVLSGSFYIESLVLCLALNHMFLQRIPAAVPWGCIS